MNPIQFECRGRDGHLELLTLGKIPGKAEYFVRVTSENGLPRIYTLNAMATQRSDTKFLPVSRVPGYVLTDLSLYWDVGALP